MALAHGPQITSVNWPWPGLGLGMAGGAPWGQAETHGTGNARTAGSSAIDMRREGRGAFLVLRLWCSLVRCAGERAFGPKEQNPREKLFSTIFHKKHEN